MGKLEKIFIITAILMLVVLLGFFTHSILVGEYLIQIKWMAVASFVFFCIGCALSIIIHLRSK